MVPNDVAKDKIIKLTLAVYRVTEIFPEKEILREKIRERSLDFASKAICWFSNFQKNDDACYNNIILDFEVLKAYFEIAVHQNWVNPQNFEILAQEYQRILEEVRFGERKLADEPSETKSEAIPDQNPLREYSRSLGRLLRPGPRPFGPRGSHLKYSEMGLGGRQKAIVEHLKNNGAVKVGDLCGVFPQVSKRTLRRDCERLLKLGVLERQGSNQNTFYKINGNVLAGVS